MTCHNEMVFFSFDHLCNGKWLFAKVRYSFIMPPVSRRGLGLSVHLSVCLSVTLCIRSRMVRDRILELNIWNVHEWTFRCRIVSMFRSFLDLLHYKPMEPCQQNTWRTTELGS